MDKQIKAIKLLTDNRFSVVVGKEGIHDIKSKLHSVIFGKIRITLFCEKNEDCNFLKSYSFVPIIKFANLRSILAIKRSIRIK